MQNTNGVKEIIKNGSLDQTFLDLYFDYEGLEKQRNRYVKAIEKFEHLYGAKEIEIYSAPGRTEIGGNHTDHQNGKVLAGSIDLDAIAVVAKTEATQVKITSEGYPALSIDISTLEPVEEEIGKTHALIRGVAAGMKKRGYNIGGFEAYVTSDVLSGSGLSSSAAYEVLIGNILSGLYNSGEVDPVTIAQIGQEAEREYFGKPCGLMDQMACSYGGMIYIDFENSKSPLVKKVDVDFNKFGYCLCIIDTKGSHADLTDEYAAVPSEMNAVAEYFGKTHLREVNEEEFYLNISNIRTTAGDRAVLRAFHWFNENRRVEKQVESLEAGDFDAFKKYIRESGESSFKYLQNVFATKAVNSQSVSLALALGEKFVEDFGVVRVHGGGFAGTIQAFVKEENVKEFKNHMEAFFGVDSCYVLHIRPVGGKKIV
ncbi:MAG: galactokinase [Lachnospiraceae bacterium]